MAVRLNRRLSWLDRRVAAPGPYMALCLHQHEFDEAMRALKISNAGPWISTPRADATAHFLTGPNGQLCCVLCLNEWQGRDPVEVAGLLAHEAVHIWQEYCRDIGERHPGDEQEAYAVQGIAQTLMAEFARRVAR